MSERWIGLLRGVNVGGRNRLPMAELARITREAGGADVQTVLQSGNVLYTADADLGPAIQAGLAALGIHSPVISRTADALRDALADLPFPEDEALVMFLGDLPDPAQVAALDPDRSPGDRFVVRGREVHLHLPNGVADTKLTNAWLDRSLGTVSTGRNLRTLRRLLG